MSMYETLHPDNSLETMNAYEDENMRMMRQM